MYTCKCVWYNCIRLAVFNDTLQLASLSAVCLLVKEIQHWMLKFVRYVS